MQDKELQGQEEHEGKELRSLIPDLRQYLPNVFTQEFTQIYHSSADNPRKYSFLEEERVMDYLGSQGGGCGLIEILRKALARLRHSDPNVPSIPFGGTLCEIGGPSTETRKDIIAGGVEKMVILNSSGIAPEHTILTELSLDADKAIAPHYGGYKAYSYSINNAERNQDIITSEGRFDYVTSYLVFGDEVRSNRLDSSSANYGADLRTPEQRKRILDQIALLLKPGGIFGVKILDSSFRTGHFSPNGFPLSRSKVVIGFDVEELEQAGFFVMKKEEDQEEIDRHRPRSLPMRIKPYEYIFQYHPIL